MNWSVHKMLSQSDLRILLPVVCTMAFFVGSSTARAAEHLSYQTPPPPLADLVDAPRTPIVRMAPENDWALLIEYPNTISLAELSEPEMRLAGMRFKPTINGPSRVVYGAKLTFRKLSNGLEREVTGLPADARLAYARWSPDGAMIAFAVNDGERFTLWIADRDTAQAKLLSLPSPLNAVNGSPIKWMSDSKHLLCALVPQERGAPPVESPVPHGPVVQQNMGRTAPARTYQDLLEDRHDEALFEYYLTSQLVRVGIDNTCVSVGPPSLFASYAASPDGNYILATIMHPPYSYIVPAERFPRRIEIWKEDGECIKVLADLPLQEEVPIAFGSVPTGHRSVHWRSDTPATLAWAEAQDGGDARREAEVRDHLYLLSAPFDADPRIMMRLALRYGGVQWGTDTLATVYSWWWNTRNQRTYLVSPGDTTAEPTLLWDRSWEDRYNDPGQPIMKVNARGHAVLHTTTDGKKLFLIGNGASPEGDRPFFDLLDLATHESERRFRSEAPFFESPVAILDDAGTQLLTRRESVDEPPNYFVRDLTADPEEQLQPFTDFPHPTPQLKGLTKELLRYERRDGVKLTGTLYLPPNYVPERDGRLPLIVWAYPQEFKSADAAGQVNDSPYRFDRVGWWSPLLFLARGYAVLDNPTMPIVGEGEVEPNDTYIEQLVASAEAAVNAVVDRGVADRQRVAIGGHSYGAFMAANLLAHSDLFCAGIARSGAYNRTLTPFGFQAEERSIWEATDTYVAMSPFLHAEKINEPILLVHGQADNNSGTFPMQSERLFAALKGLGATVRLVMLPHESHAYQARESIQHMLWETSEWLDRYVKNGAKKSVDEKSASDNGTDAS